MDHSRALKWAGLYLGLSTLSLLVGLALIAGGVVLSGASVTRLIGFAQSRPLLLVRAAAPTVLLVLLGLLVWRLGQAFAFYRTLVAAVEAETADRFDTEAMKSDILAVLDERLSEMHRDVEQTRRVMNRLGAEDAASEFEFSED